MALPVLKHPQRSVQTHTCAARMSEAKGAIDAVLILHDSDPRCKWDEESTCLAVDLSASITQNRKGALTLRCVQGFLPFTLLRLGGCSNTRVEAGTMSAAFVLDNEADSQTISYSVEKSLQLAFYSLAGQKLTQMPRVWCIQFLFESVGGAKAAPAGREDSTPGAAEGFIVGDGRP